MARKATRRIGQGTCFQRKDGRWEAAVTVGYNESGNPIRKRLTRRTQREAVEALNSIIANINLGVPIGEGSQTLAEFIPGWLENVIRPTRATKTYRYYEQLTRLYILPRLGRLPLTKISPQHVQALMSEWSRPRLVDGETVPGLAPRTVNGIRATLRSALTTAWRWELIRENPCSRVSPAPKRPVEPVYLTPEEARALIQISMDHYLGGLIELALLTGLRIGEATGLRWDDVDLERGTIRVRSQLQWEGRQFVLVPPKSSAGRRTLSLTARGVMLLRQHQARQSTWGQDREDFNQLGLVFTSVMGRPLFQKTVDENLKKFALAAGIEKSLSFHKLRHTVATHLAASGLAMPVVRDQMGHSQISVTMDLYGHAVPAALKHAAEEIDLILRG